MSQFGRDWEGATAVEVDGGISPDTPRYVLISHAPPEEVWRAQLVDGSLEPSTVEFEGDRASVIEWALGRTENVWVGVSGIPETMSLAEFLHHDGLDD